MDKTMIVVIILLITIIVLVVRNTFSEKKVPNVIECRDDDTGVVYLVFTSEFGMCVVPKIKADGTIVTGDEVEVEFGIQRSRK